MNWYYSKGSTQLGPVSVDELRAKISSGEVLPSDLAWRDGMGDWKPVSMLPELAVNLSKAEAPSFAPPAQAPYQAHVPQYQASWPVADIPNYLWQSIVVTILCCLPFGVVAIVNAAKVDSLKDAGNFQQAKVASDSAKKWCIVSLVCWLVAALGYGVFVLIAILGAGAGGFQQ